ncbi:MAG: tetratricopeptide repeat protein, partial [Kordiimonadaceae bacterium]|nr:tetratricopeptide repeat protein [Kordiimonadaceae bacterium]
MKKNLLLMVLFILSFGQVFAQTADDKDIDTLQKIIEQLQGDDRQSGLAQLSSQADILGSSLKVSKDADGYLLLGRAYFYAELDDQANKNLNLALKYNPLLPQAHFFSGLLAMFTGKLDDAEQSFRTAIQLDTGIDAYRNELARILVMKKDESGALMAFQNALKVNPENIEAQIGSAQIYMGQGNNEKAELLFLSTLKTDPDRIFVNSNLGQLYQNIENHKGALKYFTKAHQINPNDWRLTAKLIQEYHALGRMKERDDLRDKLYQTWGSGKAPDLNQ